MTDIVLPPEMLPRCDGADIVVCQGNCDQKPPCPNCIVISGDDDDGDDP